MFSIREWKLGEKIKKNDFVLIVNRKWGEKIDVGSILKNSWATDLGRVQHL